MTTLRSAANMCSMKHATNVEQAKQRYLEVYRTALEQLGAEQPDWTPDRREACARRMTDAFLSGYLRTW